MEIQQVWSSDFKILELNLIFPESWPHSMEILSEEEFYNWAVYFEYFKRGGETCNYLNSNKYFNIAFWTYVSI